MWDEDIKATKAVPSLYLLGCMKCSTTSFARALSDHAGVRMLSSASTENREGDEKEFHFFDGCACGRTAKCHVAEYSARDQASHSIMSCERVSATPELKQTFARANQYVCDEPGAVCDATPNNMRLVGLEHLLSTLYEGHASRLNFVFLLRSPVERMQSEFYFRILTGSKTPGQMGTFVHYVQRLQEKLPENYTTVQAMQSELAVQREDVGMWYNSMYALQMRHWLESPRYHAAQFVVLPMKWTMTHTRDAVALLDEAFPTLNLKVANVPQMSEHLNTGEHAGVIQDLPPGLLHDLNNKYFNPDIKALASMLETARDGGLRIGGYVKGVESIESHMLRWW
jgi:hypothetical protein